MLYCDFALQYLYGAPKPEEDSALKRMLGKTLVLFFLIFFFNRYQINAYQGLKINGGSLMKLSFQRIVQCSCCVTVWQWPKTDIARNGYCK